MSVALAIVLATMYALGGALTIWRVVEESPDDVSVLVVAWAIVWPLTWVAVAVDAVFRRQ